MARRLFFVPEVRRDEAELTGEAAQHLVRVLRVEAGEMYEISDNRQRYLAEVSSARKSAVTFRVLERLGEGAPVPEVTLVASLFKFDHFEWMLEKAAELNVARIVPVVATRSEKGLEQAAPKRMERWRRILLEASQQCRRTVLPELDEVVGFEQALAWEATHRWMLDEDRSGSPLAAQEVAAGDSAALLLGPEGGWTEQERAAAREGGWKPVTIAANVLRAETAALAGLALAGQLFARR
jgi:16S rRNA (uracil1498-N3)-methyltransferase